MTIKVKYSSVDRFSKTATFKTLKGAQAFAHKWVGAHPEMGSTYAVSGDGIGKVTVTGATLAELFPERAEPVDPRDAEHEAHNRADAESFYF